LDHRVLLNNILTPDKSLRILENEFSKRGLGAVTFPAGLTMGGYRRLLSVICAYPEEIQRNGGIKRYFEQNQVEGVRVIPGQKGTSSMEATVLEGDPESLMAAQNAAALEGQVGAFGLDLLLEAVGMGGGGGAGGGSGYGTGFGARAGSGSGTGVSAAAAPGAGEVASGGFGGVIPQGTGESGLGGDGTGPGGDSTAAHAGAEAGSAGVEAVLAGMTRGS